MKTKIEIVLFILSWMLWLFTETAGAQGIIYFDDRPLIIPTGEAEKNGWGYYDWSLLSHSEFNCERIETDTGWKPDSVMSCAGHDWIYAEFDDVNEFYDVTYSVYYPCGRPGKENMARICSICGQHERRQVSWYYQEKLKQGSLYKTTKKAFDERTH